jgi:uncharacterized membrane protein YphA (DoxX/SURF4 family)
VPGTAAPRGEAPVAGRVRDLFLRLLGLVFLAAFLSLLVQVDVLWGRDGLLPAAPWLERLAAGGAGGWLATPTLFRLSASDGALRAAAVAGALASLGLVLNLAPRAALLVAWLLYLSFVTIGRDFLSFQWDNLLLESAFFTLFVAPRGLRPGVAPAPHPAGVFLLRWLLFRLHVESGAAKLLGGDPSWRDLTALASYYETAPLPTWLGWYAHQMPLAAHRLCGLFSLAVELGAGLLVFGPRRLRPAAFVVMAAMQVSIVLTANYGFFNYLSLALCVFVLDDGHLAALAARLGLRLAPAPPRRADATRTALLAATAALLVAVSVVPFLPFLAPGAARAPALAPVRSVLAAWRSINAYHLFVHMTRVRNEPVIEGSADGTTWASYEFRYKPGDVDRAPPFVAPHQPRVDFLLWFLTLGGRTTAPYFETLLARLVEKPAAVAPLFARNPFPESGPAFVRVAYYRYRFTDAATRRRTGAWWHRDLLGHSRPLERAAFRSRVP